MVYKSGFKNCLMTVIIFGVLYGLFMGLFAKNVIMGIVLGVVCGFFFALGLSIFSKRIEKKSKNLRMEISKVRKIICEGPANQKKGANAIGGWLFLSEDAIEFYPHKMNFGGQNIPILLDDVMKIETKSNYLKIYTKTNDLYTFVVNKAKLWESSINEVL